MSSDMVRCGWHGDPFLRPHDFTPAIRLFSGGKALPFRKEGSPGKAADELVAAVDFCDKHLIVAQEPR